MLNYERARPTPAGVCVNERLEAMSKGQSGRPISVCVVGVPRATAAAAAAVFPL